MSLLNEATEQYRIALKMAQRYERQAVASGKDPYLKVLDEIMPEREAAGRVEIGRVEIPLERVLGTKTAGRRSAFAGNFMPLLDPDTEFGMKWIMLCCAHLSEEGIRDPIRCYEYLGNFYVLEGNKRVSVLRSYDAPTIMAKVTRLLPPRSDSEQTRVYDEFVRFFKLSGTYLMQLQKPGGYARLQAALGFDENHVWTSEERSSFQSVYYKVQECYGRIQHPERITTGDLLMTMLEVYRFQEIGDMAEEELQNAMLTLLPDSRAETRHHSVAAYENAPSDETAGFLNRLSRVFAGPLQVAFIHSLPREVSRWTNMHELGRESLEEALGDEITVRTYVADGDPDETFRTAAKDGAEVIFATAPTLMPACRRIAAENPRIRVLNCGLFMPYASVRSYYCRLYEAKFIAGAIAGAMERGGRIGYVADYPIYGVPACVNAYALGAQMTNPQARVVLEWSCRVNDPVRKLLDEGVSVISSRESAAQEENLGTMKWGTFRVLPDGTHQPLASPCWDWGMLYEHVVSSILKGSYDSSLPNQAINYWWGMPDGVVDVLVHDSVPQGVRQLAGILKEGLRSRSLDPFAGQLVDQKGVLRHDGGDPMTLVKLMRMDWLLHNVEGEIPGFEEIQPRSRNLVRLLGVYRDQIPPEVEQVNP